MKDSPKVLVLNRDHYVQNVGDYMDSDFIRARVIRDIRECDLVVVSLCDKVEILKTRYHHNDSRLEELLSDLEFQNPRNLQSRYSERMTAKDEAYEFLQNNALSTEQVHNLTHMLGIDSPSCRKIQGKRVSYRNRWGNGEKEREEFKELVEEKILKLSKDSNGYVWYSVTPKGREVLKTHVGDFHYDNF